MIFAGGSGEALAAKAATSTIPIVFVAGTDPVNIGLVSSLNRPGSNLTGVTLFNTLGAKRLELLHDILPNVAVVGHLVNPNNANVRAGINTTLRRRHARLVCRLVMVRAISVPEFEAAFVELVQQQVEDACCWQVMRSSIPPEGQIASLALRHGIATSFAGRPPVDAGGLGKLLQPVAPTSSRQFGLYVGRCSRAKSLPTCRWCSRPSSSWSSTSRPQRRSGSRFRRHSWPAPTR